MAILEGPGSSLDGPILLWSVRGGELALDFETNAIVHGHTVRVLRPVVVRNTLGTPMSATNRFTKQGWWMRSFHGPHKAAVGKRPATHLMA